MLQRKIPHNEEIDRVSQKKNLKKQLTIEDFLITPVYLACGIGILFPLFSYFFMFSALFHALLLAINLLTFPIWKI